MTYTYCCVYSTRLLMMDRKPVRNMQSSIPKNKLEKLVHLVGFIIRMYHDARSSECQIPNLPDDNEDNHKKLQAACLLADNNIRIRSTTFRFTKSFDRTFIRETAGFLLTLFFHMCLVVSSSVRSLACNDTSENLQENNRNSVFKLLFQTPSTVSC